MSTEASRLSHQNPSALPAGTRLGEFEVLSLLGIGGFGIVYLAFDHALEREVAVKEYMPAALAGRTETLHVSIRSQSDAESFELGRKSFVNEARLLARFNDPALLKVHRFWEANGTAYMAMPVLRGRTVKEVRQSMTQPPDEAWLRALLVPLLGAIEKLHAEGVYHRDIAPDNIQIEPDGHPVLLDFGAARRVLSDKSQALTAILKPAYAPIEQYAEAGSVKQGPWTDLYALGATLHYLLLMRPPPPATARAVHDEASALTTSACPGCSQNFLDIIDWMLAPRPAERPQNVAALNAALDGRAQPPLRRAPEVVAPAATDWDRTVIMQPPAADRTVPPSSASSSVPVPAPAPLPYDDDKETATIRVPPPSQPRLPPQPPRPLPAVARQAPSRSKLLPLGLGLFALVIGASVAFGLMRKSPSPQSGTAGTSIAAVADSAATPAATATTPTVATPAAQATPQPAAIAEAPTQPPASTVAATGNAAAVPSGRAESAVVPVVVVPTRPATPPAVPLHAPASAKPTVNVRSGATPPAAPVAEVAPSVPAQAEPVRTAAQASPAAVQPAPAVKAAATNPEALCSGRNPLSYFVCMDKECRKSEQIGTADCRAWHKNARNPND